MSQQRRRSVSDEHFTANPFTEDSAIRARQEGKLCADILTHPGWSIAREQWERLGAALRRQQLSADGDALHDIQSTLRACDIPQRVLEDAIRDAQEAERWQAEREAAKQRAGRAGRPYRPPKRQSRPFTSDTEAEEAIARARTIESMVELPGWKMFVRRLAATAYAAHLLLDWADPQEAKTVQAMIRNLGAPVRALQEVLDRGKDAEQWFQSMKQKEQGKE